MATSAISCVLVSNQFPTQIAAGNYSSQPVVNLGFQLVCNQFDQWNAAFTLSQSSISARFVHFVVLTRLNYKTVIIRIIAIISLPCLSSTTKRTMKKNKSQSLHILDNVMCKEIKLEQEGQAQGVAFYIEQTCSESRYYSYWSTYLRTKHPSADNGLCPPCNTTV